MTELLVRLAVFFVDKISMEAEDRAKVKRMILAATVQYNRSALDSAWVRREYDKLVRHWDPAI